MSGQDVPAAESPSIIRDASDVVYRAEMELMDWFAKGSTWKDRRSGHDIRKAPFWLVAIGDRLRIEFSQA